MARMKKTYYGRICTTLDALLVFEACRRKMLPMVSRRLLALERQLPPDSYPFLPSSTTAAAHATLGSRVRRKSRNLIDHGTVFVFHQEGSNINRWTDGLTWSPSRIAGNFLMYKELLHKFPNDKCKTSEQKAYARTGGTIQDPRVKEMVHREGLVVLGSAKGTFIEKNGGLIKKTITVQGLDIPPPEELQNWQLKRDVKNEQDYVFPRTGTFHLVCYERPGDTTPLITPSNDPKLRNLSLSRKFVTLQAFRNPMEIQQSQDDNQPWPLNEFVASSRIIEGRPPSKRHGCSQKRARRHAAARATELRAVEGSDPYAVLVNMNICQSANHTDYRHDDKDEAWRVTEVGKFQERRRRVMSSRQSNVSGDQNARRPYVHHLADQINLGLKRKHSDDFAPSMMGSCSPFSLVSSLSSSFSFSETAGHAVPSEASSNSPKNAGDGIPSRAAINIRNSIALDACMDYLPEMNGYSDVWPTQTRVSFCPESSLYSHTPLENTGMIGHSTEADRRGGASERGACRRASRGRGHHHPYFAMPYTSPVIDKPNGHILVMSSPPTPVPFFGCDLPICSEPEPLTTSVTIPGESGMPFTGCQNVGDFVSPGTSPTVHSGIQGLEVLKEAPIQDQEEGSITLQGSLASAHWGNQVYARENEGIISHIPPFSMHDMPHHSTPSSPIINISQWPYIQHGVNNHQQEQVQSSHSTSSVALFDALQSIPSTGVLNGHPPHQPAFHDILLTASLAPIRELELFAGHSATAVALPFSEAAIIHSSDHLTSSAHHHPLLRQQVEAMPSLMHSAVKTEESVMYSEQSMSRSLAIVDTAANLAPPLPHELSLYAGGAETASTALLSVATAMNINRVTESEA